jgi:hypothetical protein
MRSSESRPLSPIVFTEDDDIGATWQDYRRRTRTLQLRGPQSLRSFGATQLNASRSADADVAPHRAVSFRMTRRPLVRVNRNRLQVPRVRSDSIDFAIRRRPSSADSEHLRSAVELHLLQEDPARAGPARR